MAYAIRVRNIFTDKIGKHRHGWLGRWNLNLISSINDAMRWGKVESAETAALLHVVKEPNLIGKLEVVCIVVGPRPLDGWRIHTVQPKKEHRHGTVLR